MLVGCSRCGKVHERGACPLRGVPFNRGTQNKGYVKKWGTGHEGIVPEQRKFRSSAAWQRKRQEILSRDLYCCRMCLDQKILTRDHLQVHHIIPIREADYLKLDEKNLITLCYRCHEKIENDKEKRKYLQRLVEIPPVL